MQGLFTMKRRDFLSTKALGVTAIALSGCHRAEEETKEGSINVNKTKR